MADQVRCPTCGGTGYVDRAHALAQEATWSTWAARAQREEERERQEAERHQEAANEHREE